VVCLFSYTEPILTAGRILKESHLKDFASFPRDVVSIMFQGYGNGILSGCEIKVSGNKLTVHNGLIINYGQMYFLAKPVTVEYQSVEVEMMLKVRFLPEDKSEDFRFFNTEIFVDNNVDIKQNEMELCRFKMKPGAELRTGYQSFDDMMTEYDTAHLVYAPYACKGGVTISPQITANFASEAFLYKMTDPLDISFCFNCLQNVAVPKEMIFAYLNSKFPFERLTEKGLTNIKVYQLLSRALFQISKNRHTAKDMAQEKHRVFVD